MIRDQEKKKEYVEKVVENEDYEEVVDEMEKN